MIFNFVQESIYSNQQNNTIQKSLDAIERFYVFVNCQKKNLMKQTKILVIFSYSKLNSRSIIQNVDRTQRMQKKCSKTWEPLKNGKNTLLLGINSNHKDVTWFFFCHFKFEYQYDELFKSYCIDIKVKKKYDKNKLFVNN